MASQKEMNDDRLLEALALQSLVNEARQKEEMQRKAHAERLRALAELAEMEDDEDEDEVASSPTSVTTTHTAPPLTMQEIVRESKRRGDIASRFFE